MSPAVEVNHVWKKFRKGEFYDSLRDLIPAMARRLRGRGVARDELGGQEFWALRDVDFSVDRGASLGVIGPNGAGKSTLLKLLSRIIRPNRGTYQVHGRCAALIEVGAGFHQDLTGRENIYLNGVILGMKRKEIRAKEDQIIDFAGVEEFIDTPVKRYSSGMKARLGFAVSAHLQPDVLLVDEVLSVGDARFRAKCIRHMQELVRSEVTVIFISHLLDQVRRLCPQTIVLDHGQVVYQGQTDGAIRKYLDLLGDDPAEGSGSGAGEIVNVIFRDEQGREVLEWESGRPAAVEMDVVLRQAVVNPTVLINFHNVGGGYLGTAHASRQGLTLQGNPGVHKVRFTLDPMPLGDGDYELHLRLQNSLKADQVYWQAGQPRTISVRGMGFFGPVIRCDGRWELLGEPVSDPI